MRPAYAFERFGKGGVAIYDGLRRGQDKLAFNTKQVTDFSEKTFTPKEVKEWGKEIKEFSLSDGSKIKMPVTHVMGLYELMKRRQDENDRFAYTERAMNTHGTHLARVRTRRSSGLVFFFSSAGHSPSPKAFLTSMGTSYRRKYQ